jgi:hypothetical protein
LLRSTSFSRLSRNVGPFAALFALFPLACSSDGGATGGPDAATDALVSGDGAPGNDTGPGSDGAGLADAGVDAAVDHTPPTVTSSYPMDASTGQATTTEISATFSKPMAPLTLDATTFTVKQGSTAVAGTVSYYNQKAVFSPAAALALGATYTATITTGATDVAGDALGAAFVWSFSTDSTPAVGPAPVVLGASGAYVVLADSAISNVPTSAVTGNVGLSPAAASYITGFSLTRAGTKWTSPQVVGGVFAADNDPPTPNDLTVAVGAMRAAYTDAAGRPTPDHLNLGGGAIGGMTLAPGLYNWTSAVTIPADITLAGAANDTWIFQVSGDLSLSAAKKMTLSGGARAKNIVWQVTGLVDLGTTSHAEGVMLSKTAIKLETGSSINGRLYAQTAVSLASATVTVPAP